MGAGPADARKTSSTGQSSRGPETGLPAKSCVVGSAILEPAARMDEQVFEIEGAMLPALRAANTSSWAISGKSLPSVRLRAQMPVEKAAGDAETDFICKLTTRNEVRQNVDALFHQGLLVTQIAVPREPHAGRALLRPVAGFQQVLGRTLSGPVASG